MCNKMSSQIEYLEYTLLFWDRLAFFKLLKEVFYADQGCIIWSKVLWNYNIVKND